MNSHLKLSNRQVIDGLLAQFQNTPGGLLPLLHAVQDTLGFIPPESVDHIADGFNRSRAEVHGVITYYHHFRMSPPGRHLIQVCRGEACQACGSEALLAEMEGALGCKSHDTSADGNYTLEAAYCLGLCSVSPAVQVDDRLIGRANVDRVREVLNHMEGKQ
ncbi:formate dehydrogenase subunit gamma [Limnobacter litoralis]|uniref:Formate dehydrogenase subunit gamma n=1 Tax=Limnobacter litoralis TaxID=481366 RepID=A0ABQ5YT20_9BURK|nr:formate dehydrogenase subunit gamma [Limnobacter litoralis]GLR27046.1 formate dehydrogenase subunit gamma [Limnobacter litoralis]